MASRTKYSLDTQAEEAIFIAGKLAKEQNHANISPAHLLTAALSKNFDLRNLLQQNDVDVYYLEDWAGIRMEQSPKTTNALKDVEWDSSMHTLFTEASNNAHLFNSENVTPESIFYALSLPGVAFTYDQLKTFPVESSQFLSYAGKKNTSKAKSTSSNGIATNSGSKANGILEQYTIDLVAQLQERAEKPYIGRASEVRKLLEVISRKRKSSAVIIGESGVGKTALMDCFGYAIMQGETPEFIKDWPILKLQNHAVIAGASYKGEVEDRLQKVFKALEAYPKSVLMIDDIHIFLDAQQKNTGFSGMLKVILEQDSTSIIATTSNDSYRKLIESDTGLYRNLEKLTIGEPTLDVAEAMLNNILEKYESYHHIKVEDEVVHNIVKLAHRYLYTRRLPDSGIDLLDRSMAVFRIMQNTSLQRVHALQEQFVSEAQHKSSEKAVDYFYQSIQHSLTPTLLARLEDGNSYFALSNKEEKEAFINKTLEQLQSIADKGFEKMSVDDVIAVLVNLTGISIGKMQSDEKEKLMQMQDILRERVIGQDVAVNAVTDAILESRSGLNKEGQPIASFFFLGPTGTGKTELAKALAQFLFQDENTIIRFDMSEFKEEHSAALLYGAPPGYVGYEEGGLLVNKIRQQPYSIVLFDEIEKAHPSVFDIFLQLLDEGKLTDKLGNVGNFTNAVILFTSNIGAEYIIQSFVDGTVPPQNMLLEKMTGYFRPEFLARITEIVPFAPIPEENVVKIFDIHLKPLIKQLTQQHIKFEIEDDAKAWLAMQGYSPKYGVRPLKNIIRTGIRKPLSKLIVSEALKPGQKVTGKLITTDQGEKLEWEISG